MSNNYKGYLLKINGNVFSNELIRHNTYKAKPYQQTDSDSYVDGNGELHRKILPHRRTSINFQTIKVDLDQKIAIQSYFPTRETVEIEYWNDETNSYKTGTFYTPDIEFSVYGADGQDVKYNEILIEFIEY